MVSSNDEGVEAVSMKSRPRLFRSKKKNEKELKSREMD